MFHCWQHHNQNVERTQIPHHPHTEHSCSSVPLEFPPGATRTVGLSYSALYWMFAHVGPPSDKLFSHMLSRRGRRSQVNRRLCAHRTPPDVKGYMYLSVNIGSEGAIYLVLPKIISIVGPVWRWYFTRGRMKSWENKKYKISLPFNKSSRHYCKASKAEAEAFNTLSVKK